MRRERSLLFTSDRPRDGGKVISRAKAIKTPDELACMREGLRITEQAIAEVQARIAPGVRQTDLTATFLRTIFDAGADANILDPIWQVMPPRLADGPWTTSGDLACPLLSTERELAEGDVLWVDTGISYAGFHSDFGRTWIVGREPDARQRAQFEKWRAIMAAVLDVTRAGATAADLTAAAIDAAGGVRPWMPHFYLGHGLGIDSAEMPYVGSDIGEAFDASLVLAAGMVLVLEPIVWDDGRGGLPRRGGAPRHRGRLGADDRLPVRPVLTVTEILPDDAALRQARRARVFAEMEAARRRRSRRRARGQRPLRLGRAPPVDRGVAGVRARGASWCGQPARSTSSARGTRGSPTTSRTSTSTGSRSNATSFLRVVQTIEGASTALVVATDGLTPWAAQLLPQAFPSAELVDGEPLMRRARQVKTAEEVEAIRASVGVAERALAAAEAALVPGVTERQLTGVFMEAMAAAGVTTPATQDVAWVTSRARGSRDQPVAAGDLVAFEAGVVVGGYSGEVGRTLSVGGDSAFVRRAGTSCGTGCSRRAVRARVPATSSTRTELPPPMPVARGLGLGFDLPLVTHALPRTAAEQQLEPGMVLALTAYVWEEGVGAVYGQEPVVITAAGPDLLSTNPFRDARSPSS